MPTYDYRCSDCNYSFEEFQKMTDDLLEICPKCSGKLKRLIGTGASPIFKGSGFYQTDYKNVKVVSSSSPKTESSKTESPKTDSVSKESKPENKKE